MEQGKQLPGAQYQARMHSVHDPDEYLAQAGDDLELENILF